MAAPLKPIVENLQAYLRDLSRKAVDDGVDYQLSTNAIYEGLTQARPDPKDSVRRPAPPDAFDRTVETLMRQWEGGTAFWGNRRPITLSALKAEHVATPAVDDQSPFSFQGGAEYASGRFVHVKVGRVLGRAREKPVERFYLYPTTERMGEVVQQLTQKALDQKLPLYFKFVDIATGRPHPRAVERTDRVVIFAGENQQRAVRSILNEVARNIPDAFENRAVPGFAEPYLPGIARADEVTAEQDQLHKGMSEGVSANSLRAKLMFQVMTAVTKQIITHPAQSATIVNGETVRQTFIRHLARNVEKIAPDTNLTVNDPNVQIALRMGLDADAMEKAGVTPKALAAIESAVSSTARDVLPHLAAPDLTREFQRHLDVIAPEYGVNAKDMSRNVPIGIEKAGVSVSHGR